MSALHRVVPVTALLLAWPHAGSAQNGAVAQEFERLHFRSIGPTTMSGRISDLAVYEANPSVYYAATAHGGVWKTTNNGTTFEPQFQDMGLIAIGDVTISQSNPELVWVGTGESNNRQSTSWGSGAYKSTDGGKTYAFMGLANSKHINRIVIHPTNNDVVLVAATGPLYGPGGDRGVFKTTDGGRTWTQVLRVDDETGANDLVYSASDPNVLYASTYQRRRTACCMNGGGPGSGIWRSTDGGNTWTRLSGNGLPSGPLGRIALDIYRGGGNTIYALIEGPTGGAGGGAGTGPGGGGGGGGNPNSPPNSQPTGLYRSDDGGQTWRKTSNLNPRPMYFSQIRIDPTNPERVFGGGVGLHLSVDGGRTFETDAALVTHDDVHAIWINPNNPNHVLIGNDGGLAVSYDYSKTWTFLPNLPVGLFYHVGYDMELPYNVCGGMQDNYNWCGPSASRFGSGIMNYDWFQIQGGDGFVAIPDQRDSRWIYTESQDGNMTRRNKVTGESRSIRPTVFNVTNATPGEAYRFHWDSPMMISPHDPGVLLVAANRVFRSRDRGDSWEAISPDLTSNVRRDSIATMGVLNIDTRIARNDGISQWPAIVTLAESPRQAGVFYTGTDDGVVSVSRDNGRTWQNITKNLPGFPAGRAYVSEVVPSKFATGTVYVTVDNHRQNDYNPYAWVSTDFGATFRSIIDGLQGEVVRTLTEDTRNPGVLYVGTETGIFLTLDRGASWRRLKGANFPTVRVDELTIQRRDNALLVATHGRALWILDHLEPIQEYRAVAAAPTGRLFTPGFALQWKSKNDRNEQFWGHQYFKGENPPTEAVIQLHLKAPLTNPMLRISDATGKVVREVRIPSDRNVAGIQTACWDQRLEPITPLPGGGGGGGGPGGPGGGTDSSQQRRPIPGYPVPLPAAGYKPANPCGPPQGQGGGGGGGGGVFGGGGGANQGPYVIPGTYSVALVSDGKVVDTKQLRIVMDPAVPMTVAERTRYNAVVADLHEFQRRATDAARPLAELVREVVAVSPKVDSSQAPADVKQEWATFRRQLDSLRVKFGIGVGGGGAPGGGGGGGGGAAAQAAAAANVLGRLATLKGAIAGVWEMPSAGTMSQADKARADMTRALSEIAPTMQRARAISATLARFGVTLKVP